MSIPQFAVAFAAVLALMSLGGGAYEYLVVDPAWPKRPDLIQPHRGGISRKRFWIPAHGAFEVLLLCSLFMTWHEPAVRTSLLVAFASHATLRIWSFVDLIPKALVFEQADPVSIQPHAAERWSRRSLGRLPLAVLTAGATMTALLATVRIG